MIKWLLTSTNGGVFFERLSEGLVNEIPKDSNKKYN